MDAKTNDSSAIAAAAVNDEPVDLTLDPEAAAAPPEEEIKLEHVLSRPIQAHGNEIHVLRWREPTGGDIERAGNPVKLDFSGERPSIGFDEKKMSAMMSVLAAVPPSSIRQLTAKDWNAIAWALFRFFTPPGA